MIQCLCIFLVEWELILIFSKVFGRGNRKYSFKEKGFGPAVRKDCLFCLTMASLKSLAEMYVFQSKLLCYRSFPCGSSCIFVNYHVYLDLEWGVSTGSQWSPEPGHQIGYKKKGISLWGDKQSNKEVGQWLRRKDSVMGFAVNARSDNFLYSVLRVLFLYCVFLPLCLRLSKVCCVLQPGIGCALGK